MRIEINGVDLSKVEMETPSKEEGFHSSLRYPESRFTAQIKSSNTIFLFLPGILVIEAMRIGLLSIESYHNLKFDGTEYEAFQWKKIRYEVKKSKPEIVELTFKK